MGNCLVTKLKEPVNNSDLRKMGEARIFVHQIESPNYGPSGTQRIQIISSVNQTIECIGGSFTDGEGVATSTSANLIAGRELTVPCLNGDYYITIPNKYALTKIKCYSSISMDLKDLSESNITYLSLKNPETKGDIKNLSSNPLNELLEISDSSNIVGDIKNLPSTAVYISLPTTGVLGYITELKSKTITTLSIGNCSGVKGDLDAFAILQAVGREANSTCVVKANNSGVTYNSLPFSQKTITFDGAGGYTIA